MDLSKAKFVIIALLFFFNAFLLYNNLSYVNHRGVNKETIANAVSILNARGISLECNIPSNTVEAKRLIFGNGKLKKDFITGTLLGASALSKTNNSQEVGTKKLEFISDTAFLYSDRKPNSKVNTDNTDETERYARKFLEKAGLIDRQYIVDETEADKNGSRSIRFIEKYNGFLVFDNYCMVTLSKGGITRLEYSKLQIIGFSSERMNTQIAAYQVLLANFRNGSKRVITSLDIGYKYPDDQTMEGVKTSELQPVWRIRIKGAENPEYLNPIYTEEPEGSSLTEVESIAAGAG